MTMDKTQKYLATGSIVLLAIVLALLKYWDYVVNPWTRDGQVSAYVVQIAPRVSGPIVELPVVNNQFVKAGDVLFQIDPRTFKVAVDQARAELANTSNDYTALSEQIVAAEASVEAAKFSVQQAAASIKEAESTLVKDRAEFERQKEMLPRKATSQKAYQQAEANYRVAVQQRATAVAGLAQAKANLHKAEANLAEARANRGAPGGENPQVRAAVAELEQAELDLEFTTVRAPVDGYVTKPFRLRELLARIKAILRRKSSVDSSDAGPSQISVGRLQVDVRAHEASVDGTRVPISHLELEVLRYLFDHRGEVVDRERLLRDVWGYQDSPTTRTVDNFILKLRQKIEADPSEPTHIVTVHGVGYKLIA